MVSETFADPMVLRSSSSDILPPIYVYVLHDYVLCLQPTLFMHPIEDFYDAEYVSHVASIFMVTTWIHAHLLWEC
jgi:hypothetical protein